MRHFQRFLLVAVLVNVLELGICKRWPIFKKVKALTFNTGLTGVVEMKNPGHDTSRADRRAAIIDAIRVEEADIVCLQEVMIGKDIEAIVTGLQDIYPHSHSSLHLFDGTLPSQSATPVVPPCPNQQTTALLQCFIANCTTNFTGNFAEASDFLACVSVSCLAAFQSLVIIGGEKCLDCILNQIQDPSKIVLNCAPSTLTSPLGTMNTNGLLMLSKHKFTSRRTVDFYPNTIELFVRGYLEAKVEDRVTAVCTHLFPYVSGINPEPFMQSFFNTSIEQNAYEIGQLISQFRDVKPAVLMGDFNVNGRSTSAGSGYDHFLRLTSAFNTDVSDGCSFCRVPGNVYNLNDEPSDTVIDFVFGNGLWIFNTQRVFTPDRVSIQHKGQAVPLSDHYGITGEFFVLPSGWNN
ncbi:uncharacterized protein LOC127835373 isoform X2 [Dreissena polymorpha]|uniref:Endonuclease/exonuclease/phosphatase domain-containing protein n=2 Tax=Dreissena polymorpha TaxID=45954 RepID=A0A9D4JK69_DREPO|nr:uncharacterized protein LOC127835373 isoform X2 [Dreissena polymorpha]XP_052217735.1 uncharacterized protein LOC127835373 isoform X2 [Dreissena polymorpha]KAH3815466.1 hypothetical protein DPMN_143989 [Dreissena polymorpha]